MTSARRPAKGPGIELMGNFSIMDGTAQSSLEQFILDYTEQAGGLWDEVEPQVYDVMLPSDAPLGSSGDVARIVFDPEAAGDHPRARLLGFGTPVVDDLLADAVRRGSFCRAHIGRLHLHPNDLPQKARRTLKCDGQLDVDVVQVRAMDFPQAVFWFDVTLTGDQKETHLLAVGVDLHYAREVRHVERLLDAEHLQEQPDILLPQVKRCEPAEAYVLARAQVLRSIGSIAGARSREFTARTETQIERVTKYYSDMRKEIDELRRRAAKRGTDTQRYDVRHTAIDREERIRVAELRRNSRLRVQVRPACLLVLHQPKLLIDLELVPKKSGPTPWSAVWDPLLERIEPINCPACLRPTVELSFDGRTGIGCRNCTS